ncbi:MAG: hypothetical protein KW788_02460 [Candidatus Doudnabacteria bacterium]|nr:hypothetical protein [Candidatus Doudnabacteria bacterium]
MGYFGRMALYGGRFNPVGDHHHRIAEALLRAFERLVVIPCGIYGAKESDNCPGNEHLLAIAQLGFGDLPGIEFDFSDLKFDKFTRTYDQQIYYQIMHPRAEIWHVIGGDLVRGSKTGVSAIQKTWWRGQEIWERLNFAIISHPGCPVASEDLPPHATLIVLPELYGRSTFIRKRIETNLPISHLVPKPVAEYIRSNHLYQSKGQI